MSDGNALEQAQTQLKELIEAARTGAIIPIRLPRQLEAVAELLDKAQDEQAAAAAEAAARARASAAAGDAGQVMIDNAEFFKTAIHELRTPMTSIRGYADMLSNPGMAGAMTEMQAQLLQVIRTNSRRMESLLTDMSYINKLRADMLAVNAKMDMFKNIAMMVEKKARPLADELKRQLEFDLPQGLPLLNTDGELLSHALYKLIENGLRYSAEETGKVRVSGSGAGKKLTILIEDNGAGIKPEDLPKVGTLWFRADDDAVRAYKGSGLGVAIARGIIIGLGGTMDLASEPGKGTTITITLDGMV